MQLWQKNYLLQEQSRTSSHLDAMRMHLVMISLSSVLYYTTNRNSNIQSPGMILFRHKALKRYKSTNMLKRCHLSTRNGVSNHHWHLWAHCWKACLGYFAILVPVAATTARIGYPTQHETVLFLSPLGLMLDLAPWRSSSLKNAYTLTPQNKPAKQNEELDLPVKMQRK